MIKKYNLELKPNKNLNLILYQRSINLLCENMMNMSNENLNSANFLKSSKKLAPLKGLNGRVST